MSFGLIFIVELVDFNAIWYGRNRADGPTDGPGTKRGQAMLEQFIDSNLRSDRADSNRVRLLGDTTDRRLWIAAGPLTRRMADLCLLGGALGGTALISAPERRFSSAVTGTVVDAVGRS